MNTWSSPQAPRIWRSAHMDYYGDDAMTSIRAYTDEELPSITDDGFNAVWVRGQLQKLMNSQIFPELNENDARKRIDSLRRVIERGKRHGADLYLYFNEPTALPAGHTFWDSHPELKGQVFEVPVYFEPCFSLCTSTRMVQEFLRESISNLFADLPGLGGVILITASEYLTHCWSHYARYSLGDGIHDPTDEPLQCPRCRDREPAEVVAEILQIWAEEAENLGPRPRVLAWNWSWSLWYPDPQAEIIEKIPEGVELLADWERGGARRLLDKEITIDEYSLGYAGPGERFTLSSQVAAKRNITVHAKMQLGTTCELATVPNLPLMNSLHKKLKRLEEYDVQGLMGVWNWGCTETLNRYAVGVFCREESSADDQDKFLRKLSSAYFGPVDENEILKAWSAFSEAFEKYPFSIKMLYWGPINYAPAYPLDPEYRDEPMAPCWPTEIKWGDRLEDCFGPFTLDEIIQLFETMLQDWRGGLTAYEIALSVSTSATAEQLLHRVQELRCARMICCHLESVFTVFGFHRWRKQAILKAGLRPPCRVVIDEEARILMRKELANSKRALQLISEDKRLGYNEEYHSWMVDADRLGRKIQVLTDCLRDTKTGE